MLDLFSGGQALRVGRVFQIVQQNGANRTFKRTPVQNNLQLSGLYLEAYKALETGSQGRLESARRRLL